jgi:chromosome segregation ATPase
MFWHCFLVNKVGTNMRTAQLEQQKKSLQDALSSIELKTGGYVSELRKFEELLSKETDNQESELLCNRILEQKMLIEASVKQKYSLEREVAELSYMMEAYKERNQELSHKLKALQDELSSCQLREKNVESEIEQLKSQIEGEVHHHIRDAYTDQMEMKKYQLQELSEVCKMMQQEIESLSHAINQ